MGLETSTTIAGLNALWPLGSDSKSQGDDHLRLIKSVLKAEFPGTGSAAFAKVTAQTRSRIVNGAMQIAQETTAAVTSGGYAVDQFRLNTPIATVTMQKQPISGPDGLAAIATSLTTGKPALAAGDSWTIQHLIEGTRVSDFRWGTANAKQVVVRFWAYTNQAGTYTFVIKNDLTDRIYSAPFTLVAATWTEKVIVVPGDTTGTWPIDTSRAMTLLWGLAAGTTQAVNVPGWSSTNGMQIAGHTNLAQTANNAFYLTNVGLYLDPQNTGVAPAWQMPDEAEELRACQRYWQKFLNYVIDTSTGFYTVTNQAEMRIVPAYTGGGAGFTIGAATPYSTALYQTTRTTITLVLNARM